MRYAANGIVVLFVLLGVFAAGDVAQAGRRYGGNPYARPKVIENVFVAPPPRFAPPQQAPAGSPPAVSGASLADGNAQHRAAPTLDLNSNALPQHTPAAGGHVGVWLARVGEGIAVRLELRGNGTFAWTASRGGRRSDFAGTYTFDGAKLTLTRNDQRQITGALKMTARGLNFALQGAPGAGLDFVPAR